MNDAMYTTDEHANEVINLATTAGEVFNGKPAGAVLDAFMLLLTMVVQSIPAEDEEAFKAHLHSRVEACFMDMKKPNFSLMN